MKVHSFGKEWIQNYHRRIREIYLFTYVYGYMCLWGFLSTCMSMHMEAYRWFWQSSSIGLYISLWAVLIWAQKCWCSLSSQTACSRGHLSLPPVNWQPALLTHHFHGVRGSSLTSSLLRGSCFNHWETSSSRHIIFNSKHTTHISICELKANQNKSGNGFQTS